ncbi:MAG: hypothetical protein ACK4XY_07740 [Chloroherpetonaceae bacterium]
MQSPELFTDIDKRWAEFEAMFKKKFQKTPSVETAFFIIGLQHRFNKHTLEKGEKEALIAEGFYITFEKQGYFSRNSDGTWKVAKPLPELSDMQREVFYRHAILSYFDP